MELLSDDQTKIEASDMKTTKLNIYIPLNFVSIKHISVCKHNLNIHGLFGIEKKTYKKEGTVVAQGAGFVGSDIHTGHRKIVRSSVAQRALQSSAHIVAFLHSPHSHRPARLQIHPRCGPNGLYSLGSCPAGLAHVALPIWIAQLSSEPMRGPFQIFHDTSALGLFFF